MPTPSASVQWLDWSALAFARAATERRPVLLAITASWCSWCHEMDRTSYADPEIAALINSRFVPIRVDSDRRPDINERYNLGGWPTTAFLTPDGDLLGGSTYMPPDRLAAALRQVSAAYASRQDDVEARAAHAREARAHPNPSVSRAASLDDLAWFEQLLRTEFDARDGGFGIEPKLPHAPALQLAVDLFCDGRDSEWLAIFTRSLDAMGWGGLYDAVDGGFYRYATTRDWSLPHSEKLLEDNAALLLVYLEAWHATRHRSYRDKAIDVIRFVHATLADVERGGFFASQAADPAYSALAAEARRERPAPPVDRTMYTDVNGTMAAAYLRAACLLDDATLGEFAVQTLERIILAAYRPGDGLAHALEAERNVAGLLTDHVWISQAFAEAYDASGKLPFIEMAEELMRHCLRTMWDAGEGGFFDRAAGLDPGDRIGLLNEPLKPLALNCQAARTLARIAAATGHTDLADAAQRALSSQASSFRELGLHAAPYALAVRAILRSP